MDVVEMKVDVSRPPSNILGFESENVTGKRGEMPFNVTNNYLKEKTQSSNANILPISL
jgi:hypothetical protein